MVSRPAGADLTGGVAELLPLRGDPTAAGRLLVDLLI